MWAFAPSSKTNIPLPGGGGWWAVLRYKNISGFMEVKYTSDYKVEGSRFKYCRHLGLFFATFELLRCVDGILFLYEGFFVNIINWFNAMKITKRNCMVRNRKECCM